MRRGEASAVRLVGTLGGAGALAGLALVFVFQATQPRIRAHKAAVLRRAVREVLHEPARFETLFVVDGALRAEAPDGDAEAVFLGYDEAGTPVGFAIVAAEPGFQDVIRLIFGYDPRTRRVLGMRVLESRETPGLGDKIEKDREFVGQFFEGGLVAPLTGVRDDPRAPGDVDMITGATISSRAVVRIVNHALERVGPALEAHLAREAAR